MTNAVANTANAFTKSNLKHFIHRVKPVTWAVMWLLLVSSSTLLNNVGEFKYIGAYGELQDEAYTDLGCGQSDVDYCLDTNRYDGPVANGCFFIHPPCQFCEPEI
jgi:hypothetical protein